MPSTSIQFAWALPVKVEVLGAHLQAHEELQPGLDALRLCNRYGKRPRAYITKLPVEVVDLIEVFLTQAKRAKILPEWVQALRCWEDKCQPIEHMDDATILQIYNSGKRDVTPGGFDNMEDYEVTPWIRECVSQDLVGCRYSANKKPFSLTCQMAWRGRVGHPACTSRGKFDQFGVMLRKDFGLDVWISHVQREKQASSDDSVSHSTIASLRLPHATSAEHLHEPEHGKMSLDMYNAKSEVGMMVTHMLPAPPSKRSQARFDHALKALDI